MKYILAFLLLFGFLVNAQNKDQFYFNDPQHSFRFSIDTSVYIFSDVSHYNRLMSNWNNYDVESKSDTLINPNNIKVQFEVLLKEELVDDSTSLRMILCTIIKKEPLIFNSSKELNDKSLIDAFDSGIIIEEEAPSFLLKVLEKLFSSISYNVVFYRGTLLNDSSVLVTYEFEDHFLCFSIHHRNISEERLKALILGFN